MSATFPPMYANVIPTIPAIEEGIMSTKTDLSMYIENNVRNKIDNSPII